LNQKNIPNIDEKMESLLDEYIGKDFSFVISWITNLSEFTKVQNVKVGENKRVLTVEHRTSLCQIQNQQNLLPYENDKYL